MTDLTKLADDLEVVRQSFREMSHADRKPDWFTGGPRAATAHRLMWQRKGLDVADSIDEAARILRSAAGVDVAGLMALAGAMANAQSVATLLAPKVFEQQSSAYQKADAEYLEAEAALESALRMALAAREGFVLVPVEPTEAMVKAGGEEWRIAPGSIGGYGAVQNIYRAMIYHAVTAAEPKGTP